MHSNNIFVPREDVETINRLCLSLLDQSYRIKKSKVGRPSGTGKRKASQPADPERLDKIRLAIETLSPNVDANWTSSGLPRTPPIQSITGFTDVAIWEVKHACPGYNREKAMLHHDQEFLYFKNGEWQFYMVRNERTFRWNLRTADIAEARSRRNHFLKHGNWEYQKTAAGDDMPTNPSCDQINWRFAGPGTGWVKD